jgi:DNA replication and repair protein RecF
MGPSPLVPHPLGAPIGRIVGLSVRSFRNLADADVQLPEAGCLVVGPNGHGKTSLIEALLYCEVFRSSRGAADRELVRFGDDGFHVSVAVSRRAVRGSVQTPQTPSGVQSDGAQQRVTAGYDARTKAKKVTVDGAVPERMADAIGVVRGVVLSPGDVLLVAGGPRERRHYLDVLLALTEDGYVEALATYRRALQHRAHAADGDAAAPWEHLLAEHGARIVQARRRFIERWARVYAARCNALGEERAATLEYATRTDGTPDALREALARSRERDLARGRTSVGPHRDDLRLALGGHELRHFGSAGQQRTAALALRLVEAGAQGERGATVSVCLDDAFAELDERRSRMLGAAIEELAREGSQVVAAVPKESDIPEVIGSLPRWSMQQGRVLVTQ